MRPVYPAFPPGAYPPPGPPRRRWPSLAAAAAVGAVVAATLASVIATQLATERAESSRSAPTTVTMTATPTPPPSPAPLPTAQADRQTCNAWLAAGKHVDAASTALETLPKGMKIMDPQVRGTAEFSALVRKAASEYNQAGDTLAGGITPGTTAILSQAATTAVAALHAVSTGDATYDVANGNTFQTWKEAAGTVNVLCERLAPR